MNSLKKDEILRALNTEILKIRESAQKTDEASKLKISTPSQSGNKSHSEAAAELTNKYFQKLSLLKKELAESSNEDNIKVIPPCFLKITYSDNTILDFVLVENIISLSGILFISANSPLGKAVLGKTSGQSFSYSLENGNSYFGTILSVE